MQLYALDEQNNYTNVVWAVAGQNYTCPECGDLLRVRGGLKTQRHYYHYKGKMRCRQGGKSSEHLMVQQRILQLLPEGSAKMEMHFPAIGRVADVAWQERQVVFEVQCAAMTAEEALARMEDYRALGWTVVWILHDQRYNSRICSAMEEAIWLHPHYYTNISNDGKGEIYDQLVLWKEGRRYAESARRLLDEQFSFRRPVELLEVPKILRHRMADWILHCKDDYLGLWQRDPKNGVWLDWKKMEQQEQWQIRGRFLKEVWHRMLLRPYRLAFQWVLESCCKKG